jgi:hypothetical protein
MKKVLCQPVDGICSQCGGWASPSLMQRCGANPRQERPPVERGPGLGDRVEQALSSVGITKTRWALVRAKIGLPAGCGGCDVKQEWLNKVGEELGEAAKLAVSELWGKVIRLKQRKPPEQSEN